MICLAVLGLIIALEFLLHKSNLETGLRDIQNGTYIHYAWTVIPALILGGLAMGLSAVDFSTRSLAPYVALKRFVSKDVFVQLELLDITIPEAILIASLFTTFSASLFQELAIPVTTSITLRADRSFSLEGSYTNGQMGNSAETSVLLLESNFSFPLFAYGNLAFPEFVHATPLSTNSSLDPSAASISAVIPALRGRMDCRSYGSAQINATHSISVTGSVETSNPLAVYIDGENCIPKEPNYIFDTYPNTTFVGTTVIFDACSIFLHLGHN